MLLSSQWERMENQSCLLLLKITTMWYSLKVLLISAYRWLLGCWLQEMDNLYLIIVRLIHSEIYWLILIP